MIKINLLPGDILRARRNLRIRIRLSILAVMLLSVAAVSYSLLTIRTQAFEAEARALQQSLGTLETEINTYTPYVQLQAGVSRQMDHMRSAFGNIPDWVMLMESISAEIPDNVWLTDMTMSYVIEEDASGRLLVRGLTHHHPSTARWITSLGQIEQLGEIRCAYTAVVDEDILDEEDEELLEELLEEIAEIGEQVRFEVSAEILPGEPYEPLVRRGEEQ